MKPATEIPPNLEMFLDVPVGVTVELGACEMSMRDVLQLAVGSVVQLNKSADAPVEVMINNKLVARGEVVVVENRFGIKITEMVGTAA